MMRTLRTPGFILALFALSACGGGGASPPPSRPVPEPDPTPPAEIRVINADTVDVDGVRWRLHGIDAPETRQLCRAWGLTWECGAAATEALRSRAAGMSCAGSGTDRYGRSIGVCSSGGEDLNAWLVANGWALAYRQYADDYADEEEVARSNGRGIHAGEHVAPWDWRRGERLDGTDSFAWVASENLDAGALANRMLRGEETGFRGQWLSDSVSGLTSAGVAVSFGAWSGTNPAGIGGGVWTGAVVGLDEAGRQRIEGAAELRVEDFARPEADIVLTGLADADGAVRADMRWEDVPIVQGGFQEEGGNGWIEGRFWGSDHEEAGAAFRRNGITGAFDAKRQAGAGNGETGP